MLDSIDLKEIEIVAKEAGDIIMQIYTQEFDVEYKDDSSPLTIADKRANIHISKRLEELYPTIPILSEESAITDYDIRKKWRGYWCIDPLDGTKEFIKRNGEFTVNIAYIEDGVPKLGVVYAPVIDTIYSAKEGYGAYKNGVKLPLEYNHNKQELLRVVASKSHLNKETMDFIEELKKSTKEIVRVSKGSSLKLCMVAEGVADIYPRLAPTMEWDTAAAHAVVLGANKMVVRYSDRSPLEYNKENLLNPWFIVE